MMDIESEFKKLDDIEVKSLEENEDVKNLLTSVKSSCKNIKVGEVTIRIKAFMPKTIRLQFMRAGKELGSVDDIEGVERVEQKFYPLVASMCTDAPFNDAKTWQYIDEQNGCIQDVTMKIITEVNNTDVKIKSFRRE